MKSSRRLTIVALGIAAVSALLSLGAGDRTEAGSLVVTTTADSGPGSFRQALADAGANPGADTITFDPAVFPPGSPATINAADAYVVEGAAAGDPLTIDGTGAGVIIQGQQTADTEALLYFNRADTIEGITLRSFTLRGSVAQSDSGGEGLEFFATDLSDILIDHLTVEGNDGNGVHIAATAIIAGLTVRDSEITANGFHGLFIGAPALEEVAVTHNEASDNAAVGIDIKGDTSPSPASVVVSENLVVLNGSDGIGVFSESANPTTHITITRNATSENGGLGINLRPTGEPPNTVTNNDLGDADTGMNGLLNFPVINGLGPGGVVGTACPGCTIELFGSDGDNTHGEGEDFLQVAIADESGNFNFNGCGLRAGNTVTATATDDDGNTSEFAQNYTVPAPPACVYRNGDNDCDNDVDARDALLAMLHASGFDDFEQQPDCIGLGDSLQQFPATTSAGPDIFGDVNCDGLVDAADGLAILQHVSEVTLDPAPPETCVPIGEPLPGSAGLAS